jgi:hypothetical protein
VNPQERVKPPFYATLAGAALAECLKEAACRKATGTATVVINLNQGGTTSATWSIQDKKKT